MDTRVKDLIKEIFPLVLEVNTTTNYRAIFDTQPTFNADQIWYMVSDNEKDFGYTNCAFTEDVKECLRGLKAYKRKLQKILK